MNISYNIVFIGKGIALTLELMMGGLIIGILLGMLLSILRYNNYGTFIINRFVSLVRGTPLILQLALLYFALPSITGIKLSVLSAGILAFGINSSAYVSEIVRGSIISIPKGQFEAARVLQIPTYFLWRDIIVPQIMRSILPSLIHEMISLLKETAIISTLGGMDLMRRAQSIAAEQFSYFMPLCIAGGYYYILVLLIEYLGKMLEKRVGICSK